MSYKQCAECVLSSWTLGACKLSPEMDGIIVIPKNPQVNTGYVGDLRIRGKYAH